MKKIVICGNGLGVVVLALELSNSKNIDVTVINSKNIWGGYFGGIESNGVRFDLGMNLFEFKSYIDSSSNIFDYNPYVKSDSGRFSDLIEDYIKNVIETEIVDTPNVYFRGSYYKDYYISNSLEILSALTDEEKFEMIAELKLILMNPNNLHARNKNKNPELFYKYSYLEVSLANHGRLFHDKFIEPLVLKILNIESNDIPAVFHRIPWAPLFYPESLLDYLASNRSPFLEAEFEYPKKKNFSALVDKLVGRMLDKQNVQVLNEQVASINFKKKEVILETKNKIAFDELIYGNDLLDFDGINNKSENLVQFRKENFTFVFIRVKGIDVRSNFSVLFIVDSNVPCFRITNQSNLKKCVEKDYIDLIIEFNTSRFEESLDSFLDVSDMIGHYLNELRVVEVFKPVFIDIRHFKNALTLPTFDNVCLYDEIKSRVDKIEDVHFIGNVNAMYANSFNDNIVQALLISKKIQLC